MTPIEALESYFGYHSFREGQEQVISRVLSGRDVFAVMPTGAGKSLCYQIPATIFEGVSLVVSPLISLMKDQVSALTETGIPAAMINSSMEYEEIRETTQGMRMGAYKLVYVAPERLLTEDFLEAASRTDIASLIVDEAHCVSQWGQNFRPNYLDIPKFVDSLRERPVIAAFTATATARVRADIELQLALKNPYCIVTGFNRENLHFSVLRASNRSKEVRSMVKKRKDKSGIIYCSTRKTVETLCAKLCEEGVNATRYHAGLSDEERRVNQENFQFDRASVMVATNAFGMGIDKSNVNYVFHYNMPKDIESYYQEAGRAGRDGSPAECILFYSGQDIFTNRFLLQKSLDENAELSPEQRETLRRLDAKRLSAMADYGTTTECLRAYILRYFGEKADDNCGNCGNCETDFEEIDVTGTAKAIVNCLYALERRRLSFGRTMIVRILRGQENARIKSYGIDQAKYYGTLRQSSERSIMDILDRLIGMGMLSASEGEYPVLKLSENAISRLLGGDRVTIKTRIAAEDEVKSEKSAAAKKAKSEDLPEESLELFEKLRILRRRLAAEAGIAPFMVFSDASLRDMCRLLPETVESFMDVSGVGQSKQERYGKVFTSAIREYLAER